MARDEKRRHDVNVIELVMFLALALIFCIFLGHDVRQMDWTIINGILSLDSTKFHLDIHLFLLFFHM